MCNVEKAMEMHFAAQRQGLVGAELLANHELCAKVCNGIGAAWFPKWLRGAISKICYTLVPTSWIHDREYEIGGGIWERWVADWHFLCNGWRAAFHDYKWHRLGCYAVGLRGTWCWILLRIGGQAAFKWRRRNGDD